MYFKHVGVLFLVTTGEVQRVGGVLESGAQVRDHGVPGCCLQASRIREQGREPDRDSVSAASPYVVIVGLLMLVKSAIAYFLVADLPICVSPV